MLLIFLAVTIEAQTLQLLKGARPKEQGEDALGSSATSDGPSSRALASSCRLSRYTRQSRHSHGYPFASVLCVLELRHGTSKEDSVTMPSLTCVSVYVSFLHM